MFHLFWRLEKNFFLPNSPFQLFPFFSKRRPTTSYFFFDWKIHSRLVFLSPFQILRPAGWNLIIFGTFRLRQPRVHYEPKLIFFFLRRNSNQNEWLFLNVIWIYPCHVAIMIISIRFSRKGGKSRDRITWHGKQKLDPIRRRHVYFLFIGVLSGKKKWPHKTERKENGNDVVTSTPRFFNTNTPYRHNNSRLVN